MTITRRQFALASAAAAAAASSLARAADTPPSTTAPSDVAPTTPGHDMSSMPASWMGSEKIAFLVYPQFTALDMAGPYHMLASLMGSTTQLVAKTREPVRSDNGLTVLPDATFDDCPRDLDVICVPGGAEGTLAAMQDEATLRFLKDRGSRAKFVTSVCTGSLILGSAGLLDGYRATSHWAARSVLPTFGATPVDARVVTDRNRITGGGVTAGIDFGLELVGRLRDRVYAEGVQLIAEYAPLPPYDAGTPERAPVEVRTMITEMFNEFIEKSKTAGRMSFAKSKTF